MKSQNGTDWTSIHRFPCASPISVTLAATNGKKKTVFAVIPGDGLWASDEGDGGWREVRIGNRYPTAIVQAIDAPSTLLAGFRYQGRKEGGGLFLSHDFGNTWKIIDEIFLVPRCFMWVNYTQACH